MNNFFYGKKLVLADVSRELLKLKKEKIRFINTLNSSKALEEKESGPKRQMKRYKQEVKQNNKLKQRNSNKSLQMKMIMDNL